jgi:hypothetical protein
MDRHSAWHRRGLHLNSTPGCWVNIKTIATAITAILLPVETSLPHKVSEEIMKTPVVF